MFTVKYRNFVRSAKQPEEGPTHYDMCEQIHGPFTMISQEVTGGRIVVYAHNGDDPGMTFQAGLIDEDGESPPMPTLWVMNAQGATVARYDL